MSYRLGLRNTLVEKKRVEVQSSLEWEWGWVTMHSQRWLAEKAPRQAKGSFFSEFSLQGLLCRGLRPVHPFSGSSLGKGSDRADFPGGRKTATRGDYRACDTVGNEAGIRRLFPGSKPRRRKVDSWKRRVA